MPTLEPACWRLAAAEHAATVAELTLAHRQRRARGERHPVEDFIWDYYFLRPSQLEIWHPGFGVSLLDASEYLGKRGYAVSDGAAAVDPEWLAANRDRLAQILELLNATANRSARFGCRGLHEWAMVYGLGQSEIRHEQTPLRLTPAEIAQVVESQGLTCSHYDAFRFFTPAAAERNQRQLSRQLQVLTEQPGCLHANMDLYKWCYKSQPVISSELTIKAFRLAVEIRTLDMQAAPYDLSAYDLPPVEVEHEAGRAEFDRRQREFADRAAVIRSEMIAVLSEALAAATAPTTA